jgi:hypothetical protein
MGAPGLDSETWESNETNAPSLGTSFRVVILKESRAFAISQTLQPPRKPTRPCAWALASDELEPVMLNP